MKAKMMAVATATGSDSGCGKTVLITALVWLTLAFYATLAGASHSTVDCSDDSVADATASLSEDTTMEVEAPPAASYTATHPVPFVADRKLSVSGPPAQSFVCRVTGEALPPAIFLNATAARGPPLVANVSPCRLGGTPLRPAGQVCPLRFPSSRKLSNTISFTSVSYQQPAGTARSLYCAGERGATMAGKQPRKLSGFPPNRIAGDGELRPSPQVTGRKSL
jgi:hypothetical protein